MRMNMVLVVLSSKLCFAFTCACGANISFFVGALLALLDECRRDIAGTAGGHARAPGFRAPASAACSASTAPPASRPRSPRPPVTRRERRGEDRARPLPLHR